MAVKRVEWSERFRDELRREYELLRKENPVAARAVVQKIVTTSRRLRDFPHSGRTWRLKDAKELIIPGVPYCVIYDVADDVVVLLMLFHTSRDVSHLHQWH